MKFFTNNEIKKKIIIAILLVVSFNFITPTVSRAVTIGDVLFKPISELLCMISDLVIEGLQYYFMGDGDIEYSFNHTKYGTNNTKYSIKYSPGIIFSGNVPGLDINFINPSEDYIIIKGTADITEYGGFSDTIDKAIEEFGPQAFEKVGLITVKEDSGENADISNYVKELQTNKSLKIGSYEIKYSSSKVQGETLYTLNVYSNGTSVKTFSGGSYTDSLLELCEEAIKYVLEKAGLDNAISENSSELDEYKNKLKNEGIIITESGDKIEVFSKVAAGIDGTTTYGLKAIKYLNDQEKKISSAKQLQPIVATWYKSLRAIALVGLLSVLVYVGIRILISSTGQEKAKYKKMIGDWLVAICILFILQYIMVFTLEITKKITEVLLVNIIGEQGEDVLMSGLRQKLEIADTFKECFPQLIMYLVLVIYTVMFTLQYLKRLVYMAFFTMIAPLIALTYPIDKIKDGQAQAFSTWLREYIFNALLQPMHLLLYYIFVSSAISLVDVETGNPLYAVVAIGFLLPAEKFFRKMFGFDKAETSSQIGAAAGGALIMNAINKMGAKSGKAAAGGSDGSGGSGGSGGSAGSAPRYVSSPNGSPTSSGPDRGGTPDTLGQTISSATQAPKGFGAKAKATLSGAKTLAGNYVNKGNFKKIGKGLGRTARKIGVGGVGAAALGTVGLAAGIATGDLGNALKYGAAGGAAGYMGANAIGDKATAFEKSAREKFKEGALGTDEYNTRNSIKDLGNDNDFNRVCKDLGITGKADKERLIREFHSNGITNSADIKKAMNAGASTGNNNTDQLIAAAKIRKQATQYGMKRKDIEEMLRNQHGLNDTQAKNAMDLIDLL